MLRKRTRNNNDPNDNRTEGDTMKTTKMLLALLTLSLGACDLDGLSVQPDAAQAPDAQVELDTEADCTEWGRVSMCADGTVGCDSMVCLSRAPRACAPSPFPCPGVQ